MKQIHTLKTAAAFTEHLAAIGVELAWEADIDPGGPLAEPLDTPAGRAANRFAILPMEGWDGTDDGLPTDLVRRRWRRFGESGAGLIWGGEAVAVTRAARANPHQLVISGAVAALREELVSAHRARFGTADDLVVGLQLTHSGRFAVEDPRSARHDPVLDARWPATPITDDELGNLTEAFVAAARTAASAGFTFVDVKCCHGYLGHELLAAGRTSFLAQTVAAIRAAVPSLAIGMRISAFDAMPARVGDAPDAARHPDTCAAIELLRAVGPDLVCVTGGSPYYSPHVQRPAFFPPSDGYPPPEDPLIGVARLLSASSDVAHAFPNVPVVASGFSYLQQWLPNVAQAALRAGVGASIGLGRMALAYHDLPADILEGRPLQTHRLCRTFSDCTTAPRNGLVSGCWPLDDFYKSRPERAVLVKAKREARAR